MNFSQVGDIYRSYFMIGLYCIQSHELIIANETKNLLL
jgi:hypothetical protein